MPFCSESEWGSTSTVLADACALRKLSKLYEIAHDQRNTRLTHTVNI